MQIETVIIYKYSNNNKNVNILENLAYINYKDEKLKNSNFHRLKRKWA